MQVFFQSSLPRSGSTLLQNILGQNDKFYVTPTSGVIELVIAARQVIGAAPEFKAQEKSTNRKALKGFCAGGLQGYFEALTDKPYVMDKSRGWGISYNFLDIITDKPKVVCMIRDPRDIFASMEKIYRKNADLVDPSVNWMSRANTTTEKRVTTWINTLPVGLAMERLLSMVQEGIAPKVHFVKFEDLCAFPQEEMNKIYDYLEIERFEHDFNDVKQVTFENDNVHGAYGEHTIRQEVKPMRSNAQEVLGEKICEKIKNHYEWFYRIFKY